MTCIVGPRQSVPIPSFARASRCAAASGSRDPLHSTRSTSRYAAGCRPHPAGRRSLPDPPPFSTSPSGALHLRLSLAAALARWPIARTAGFEWSKKAGGLAGVPPAGRGAGPTRAAGATLLATVVPTNDNERRNRHVARVSACREVAGYRNASPARSPTASLAAKYECAADVELIGVESELRLPPAAAGARRGASENSLHPPASSRDAAACGSRAFAAGRADHRSAARRARARTPPGGGASRTLPLFRPAPRARCTCGCRWQPQLNNGPIAKPSFGSSKKAGGLAGVPPAGCGAGPTRAAGATSLASRTTTSDACSILRSGAGISA
jgi:hypothetical protein